MVIIENEIKLDFDDVLIKPKRSSIQSRQEVSLNTQYTFKHSKHTWTGTPILAANMATTGIFKIAESLLPHKIMTVMHKFNTFNDWVDSELVKTIYPNNMEYIIPSIGTSSSDLESFDTIYNFFKITPDYPDIQFVCIDVANGYSESFSTLIKNMRDKYPLLTIIAGNVCTREMTESLILAGADIIKIGIGPGANCTTRLQTGIGYPQLSAVLECADAAHGLNAHVIADGGCKTNSDIVKAFGAGADFVMLGSMLAGYEESGGEKITEYHKMSKIDIEKIKKGESILSHKASINIDILRSKNSLKVLELFPDVYEKHFKINYGMSSFHAQKQHGGEIKDYRSSEGRVTKVPLKQDLQLDLQNMLGSIRSACSYVGAFKLKQFSKCCTFIRVNNTHNRSLEQYDVSDQYNQK
jgi:GMP reductase